jgi:hypothetical protein
VSGGVGYVKADGSSAVPAGLLDMASLGQDLTLDPEVEERLHQIWKDMQAGVEMRARYKLEVAFTEKRSVHQPFGGFIVAFSNGGFAHGGGDEAVYFCSGSKEGPDGRPRACNAPLDLRWIGKTSAVCPVCRSVVKPRELTGQIYAKLSVQHWATLMTRIFKILDCNADLRIGVLRGDLRAATEKEQERERRGDDFAKIRSQRTWVVYPLTNIIKDTAAGADLYSRIRAFLSA